MDSQALANLGIPEKEIDRIIKRTFHISTLHLLKQYNLLDLLLTKYTLATYPTTENIEAWSDILEIYIPDYLDIFENYYGPVIHCGKVRIWEISDKISSINVAPRIIDDYNLSKVRDLSQVKVFITERFDYKYFEIPPLMIIYKCDNMYDTNILISITCFPEVKVRINKEHPLYNERLEEPSWQQWMGQNWRLLEKLVTKPTWTKKRALHN